MSHYFWHIEIKEFTETTITIEKEAALQDLVWELSVDLIPSWREQYQSVLILNHLMRLKRLPKGGKRGK